MPSKKDFRKSTLKQRVEPDKSVKKLRGVIQEQEDLFQEEIQRLYNLLYTVDVKSIEEIPSPTLGRSESLTWDSQADIQSPLKDTSDTLDFRFSDLDYSPPALSKKRSVSVSVNRAYYLEGEDGQIGELQPVCRSLNSFLEGSEPQEQSGLITQDSLLERNLAAVHVETLALIDEVPAQVLNEDLTVGDKMDEESYKQKLKALKKHTRRVVDKICSYGADDVSVADQDEYKGRLKDIRQVFEACIEEANTLLDEFVDEEGVDLPRVNEVNQLKSSLTMKMKKNEKEVKEKIVEVLAEHEGSRPLTEAEKKVESQKVEKIKKRMGFIKDKAKAAEAKVAQDKACEVLTDTEVREKMCEVKDLERLVQEIITSKEKAEEDAVGLDVALQEVVGMQDKVQSAVENLSIHIENLRLEDKKRGLFSALNKNISKDNIVYPEAFEGKPGENVFKFKQKFEQAIFDSQVREKDKVDVLRKHLTGEAKKLIGDHHDDLTNALKALVDYFGQADRIWEKSKANIVDKLGNYRENWGQYGSQKRVLAIAQAIEFLREAGDLAKSYPDLHNEIYHSSTLKLMKKILPRDYIEKINDLINGQEASHKKKVENVREFLEAKKNSAIEGVEDTNERSEGKSRFSDGNQPRRTTAYGESGDDDTHECSLCGGRSCNQAWQALGCLELYRKKTHDERLEWLRSKHACFLCGSPFMSGKQRHQCDWSGKGKFNARCKVDYCKSAAITCTYHKPSMTSELLKWIKSMRGNFKHLVQVGVMNTAKIMELDISGLRSNSTQGNKKQKELSIPFSTQQRESLQKGETHKHMTDNELIPFFTEDLRKMHKKSDVRPIPEGEPIFIFCVFQGRTRPIQAFIDHGCNCWVAAEGVPENELVSCKLEEGPIPMGVASGITVNASAEWASLIPLADGGHQVVRGLTVPRVTQDMPTVNLVKIFNSLQKKTGHNKQIQNIKVPKVVGGRVDMILGLKYLNIYPEELHRFPNGLTIFKSKLLPASPGAVACIGGPVSALEELVGVVGGRPAFGYMTTLVNNLGKYQPRMEFFPNNDNYALHDPDIPGIAEMIFDEQEIPVKMKKEEIKNKESKKTFVNKNKDELKKKENKKTFEINKKEVTDKTDEKVLEVEKDKFTEDEVKCNTCKLSITRATAAAIQSDMQKFMQLQEVGLDASFKCPSCRECEDCSKGSGYERISRRQEAEQELIRKSIHIDENKSRAFAELPFKVDPKDYLADNTYIAHKRLQNICKKYFNDEKVKNEIISAFDKLRSRGHLKLYEDLNPDQKKRLEAAVSSYTIPWDVVWKESSISTPTRSVFDASSKTSTGYSLNDILATGIADLAKLLDIVVEWQVGPVAILGDVSQFYPTIGMVEESWPFQKILLREDLNPNGRLIKAVIVSCIFGVCSSGGQSEEVIRVFAEKIKAKLPDTAKLLLKNRYVDDLAKSLINKKAAGELIEETEDALKGIGMNIKGWSISGEDPPEQLTEDGVSVSFAGMTWYPKIGCFKLNISNLHIGKKKRGRHSPNLKIFDEEKDGSLEKFVDELGSVSRRNCTSVVARLYDLLGKLAPVTLRFKHDLRKLIAVDPSWDNPISAAQTLRWVENFKIIQEVKDVLYFRCPIPPNAISLKARMWILCDAAEGGIMVGAYAGFPLPGDRWSCSNVLGKGLLAPEEWTIPKKELQALNVASNIKVIVMRAMGDWIDDLFIGGDSEIALAWTIYENVKLNTFHRNRVNNIRSKVSLDMLHHIQGPENPTDVGTRPDQVDAESVMPGSVWLSGKEWMTKSYAEAVKDGVIKSVKNIKLSNDEKKVMKEGIVFDTFDTDNSNVAVAKINSIDILKVAQREAYSEYLFPPLKRSFIPTVRIISIVLRAVRKLKEGLLKAKIKKGTASQTDLDKIQVRNIKFTTFQLSNNIPEENVKNKMLSKVFKVNGVTVNAKNKYVLLQLTDEDLSEGLEYLFKKATQEILKFENKKDIEKLGVMREDILYCTSRVLEGQELRAVGALADSVDLETFIGFKFAVPLVSKHSPLAVSIALHIHYNVNKHRGSESTFRMSLNHARILQGRQLFKEISDDCIYCKKLRLKYVKQLMGPLSDSQLCISPIFYFTYIDMWGPITVYCPGYEKRTRNRKMEYQVHMLVMGCAVTGAINCQVIEKKNTAAVLDGLNRFFCEVSVPKICYPDQDGALMRALTHGEVNLVDLQGNLSRERGIKFETCLPQGHYAHGRIERRIRMIQESIERSMIRNSKCTATGWQTIAKAVEREVNSVPIGFLHHQGTANPLLRVLCPSLLKNSTFSDRAPKGLLSIPNSASDLMTKIETIYNAWFQIWNTDYVPLIMDRSKWLLEGENLKTDDLVYFKLSDSPLAADWRIGKIEYVHTGRDGLVREVGIAYKNMDEENGWSHSVVERPARAVCKLMNIEDTSIIDDIKSVQELAKEILKGNNLENKERENLNDVDGPNADDTNSDPGIQETDDAFDTNEPLVEDKSKPEPKPAPKKRRKSELEKLLIDDKKFSPKEGKRDRKTKLSDQNLVMDSYSTNLDPFNTMKTFSNFMNSKPVKTFSSHAASDVTNKDYNVMSVTRPSSTVNWPKRVTRPSSTVFWPVNTNNAEDIGQTTTALMCGVTEELVRQQTNGQDGHVGGKVAGGSWDSDKNDHTVYLI